MHTNSDLLKNQPLGAHLSIAKGISTAVKNAESIQCTALAIFLHSNRQWTMKDLQTSTIDLFHKTMSDSSISINNVMVHASYLINLGSYSEEIRQKSIATLIRELEQCEILGIPNLVLHPGSHTGTSIEASLSNISENINRCLDKSKGKTRILLENMAGQGSSIGKKLENLAYIKNSIEDHERIGICIDTCHAFAAGYNLTNAINYQQFWKEFDNIIGISSVYAFHMNDSKKELGSNVDRHEHIGEGKIGLESFKLLVNDIRFANIPKVLETPYNEPQDALPLYSKNLVVLRSLIE